MKFISVLALAFAASVQACNPGQWGCGNNPVKPGEDGALYVCNTRGQWEFSNRCGGPGCCRLDGNWAGCTC